MTKTSGLTTTMGATGASGAAPESNRPSVGLPRRTGFEDRLGHQARAAPPASVVAGTVPPGTVPITGPQATRSGTVPVRGQSLRQRGAPQDSLVADSAR